MTYSAVVTYHTNPYTCGVARFNRALAIELSARLMSVEQYLASSLHQPVLISIKTEEISKRKLLELSEYLDATKSSFDLLLHGSDGSKLESHLCCSARRIFAANAELAERIREIRSDVKSLFAPGAPVIPPQSPSNLTFLTLGMAHKIRSDGYRRLAQLLSRDQRTYSLEVSTALHEGSSFDESFFSVSAEISEAFGGNLRFLGFLSDSEISRRMLEVDALVAFFPSGVRENNTTVLSAMNHGCPVITNLDGSSPSWLRHDATVFDIRQMQGLPEKTDFQRVGIAARDSVKDFTFKRLAMLLHDDVV